MCVNACVSVCMRASVGVRASVCVHECLRWDDI